MEQSGARAEWSRLDGAVGSSIEVERSSFGVDWTRRSRVELDRSGLDSIGVDLGSMEQSEARAERSGLTGAQWSSSGVDWTRWSRMERDRSRLDSMEAAEQSSIRANRTRSSEASLIGVDWSSIGVDTTR
eukprot:6211959-Pleurochrysis_carterae.AAC.3